MFSQSHTFALWFIFKEVKQFLSVKTATHKMTTNLRAFAHIFHETFERLSVLKEIMERKHTHRHVESVFAATITLFHTLAVFFRLWFRPKHLKGDFALLFRINCHAVANIATTIAVHKKRIRNKPMFPLEINITRACSVNLVFEIVLRHVNTKNKRQSCGSPFCQITGFAHRKINKRVSFV